MGAEQCAGGGSADGSGPPRTPRQFSGRRDRPGEKARLTQLGCETLVGDVSEAHCVLVKCNRSYVSGEA